MRFQEYEPAILEPFIDQSEGRIGEQWRTLMAHPRLVDIVIVLMAISQILCLLVCYLTPCQSIPCC